MELNFRSKRINEELARARLAARHATTILVLGETGTGKETVAHYIHQHSDRADNPFLKIDCSALKYELLESELFGYRAGAFTGASPRGRQSRLKLADGGTLFLDEVGDIPLHVQSKFLRLIEERLFEPLGDNQTVSIDVRIIAATHKDLPARKETGEFRQDLFYRLNEFRLHLPPLRDRPEDIEALVEYFLEKNGIPGMTDSALTALMAYHWPGNIRELRTVCKWAATVTERKVPMDLQHLPPEVAAALLSADSREEVESSPDLLDRALQTLEQALIRRALAAAGGERKKAAEVLGISRQKLYDRLDIYPDLERQTRRAPSSRKRKAP